MIKRDRLDELLSGATKRTHLIQALVEAFGYQSYLEIGCRKDETFAHINVARRVGVDPFEGGNVKMFSDDFFKQNTEKFDIIFIDGDHHHDQVYRDVTNALACLTPNGTVVMHDCSPPDAAHEGKKDYKCGTAWRAFAAHRADPNLQMIVADWDYGSGIIRKGQQGPILLTKGMDDLTYADFEVHKRDWMNLANQHQIADWIWNQLNKDTRMKIGFMGLGKLGLPCALAVEQAGHQVTGFDPGSQVIDIMSSRRLPYVEKGAQELLDKTDIRLVGVGDLINDCDLIFVAVQTPHHPRYEGVTRLPTKRIDFDYTFLKAAVTQLAEAALLKAEPVSVVIISTVLPGTIDREIRPIIDKHGGYIKLCYNPFFIAMGTTIWDFTHPEFVLFGVDDPKTATTAEAFYKTIHDRPFYKTTIKNAEMIKVAYNTFISTKLAFVNTLMEVCHKTGCDVDAVTDALKLANERLISPRYMTAGMGDGGGCHPRDNIALSWLARRLEMGFDFFEAIMLSRERQTDWFADLVEESFWAKHGQLPVIILGEAFKPETNLVTGSPSVLLANVLRERGIDSMMYDPIVHDTHAAIDLNQQSGVYFVGCKHQVFAEMKYGPGSIVIDPHRYVPDQGPEVLVIRLGEGEEK